MGLRCTADFQATNQPNCSFPFPFFQRFATVGSRKCSRPETDAMSCHSSNEAPEASETPLIRGFVIPEVWLPMKGFWRFLKLISGLCNGLHTGKAIRPYLFSHFSDLRGTGLAHVPHFYSIGKLITRSDFHRTVNWPHKSASRGHRIWHEDVPTHGRPWMAAMNLWQFYPVSLIGLPMPLFQSHGKPNTPAVIRGSGDWPDKIASNGDCSDFENSSGDCHPHEGKVMAWCHYNRHFSILQMSLLHKAGNAVRIVLITVNTN